MIILKILEFIGLFLLGVIVVLGMAFVWVIFPMAFAYKVHLDEMEDQDDKSRSD